MTEASPMIGDDSYSKNNIFQLLIKTIVQLLS